MIKANLEKFDSPIVMINQEYAGEDWGVVASYVSKKDVVEAEDEIRLQQIGWHVSVTLPNMDDVDFDQVFSTPDAALEFGIRQIVSGNLASATPSENISKDESYPFGQYESIV